LGEPPHSRTYGATRAPSGYPLHHLHGFASLAVSVVPLLSLSQYTSKNRRQTAKLAKNSQKISQKKISHTNVYEI
jgi:hypothetical protein